MFTITTKDAGSFEFPTIRQSVVKFEELQKGNHYPAIFDSNQSIVPEWRITYAIVANKTESEIKNTFLCHCPSLSGFKYGLHFNEYDILTQMVIYAPMFEQDDIETIRMALSEIEIYINDWEMFPAISNGVLSIRLLLYV